MSATTRRRSSGMSSAERARLHAKYSANAARLEAADSSTPYRKLHAAAHPTLMREGWNWPQPLSDLYTWQRRACLVRAWAALEIVRVCAHGPSMRWNWRRQARADLAMAKQFGILSRTALAREWLENAAQRTRDRARREHPASAGAACVEGKDGCCVLCGVAMVECPTCGGVGYHRDDCAESADAGDAS